MKLRKGIALLLVLTMCASMTFLSGCSQIINEAMKAAKTGQQGVSWINSDIEGAIDANTPTNVKDDFYTAVNKDWILSHQDDLDTVFQNVAIFEAQHTVDQRMETLLTDPESTDYRSNTTVGLTEEELVHAAELVQIFTAAVREVAQRQERNAEPLRPYIDDLQSIQTIEEFTAYMLDMEHRNFLGSPLLEISVSSTPNDHVNNYVLVKPISPASLHLGAVNQYSALDQDGLPGKETTSLMCHLVLEQLGYTPAQVDKIVADSFLLESYLAMNMQPEFTIQTPEYEDRYGQSCTVEEAQAVLRDYPLQSLMELYHFTGFDSMVMFEPDYMKTLAKLYTQENLMLFKNYYIVGTVLECADLLDQQTRMDALTISNRGVAPTDDDPSNAGKPKTETELLLTEYIRPYLAAPLDMLYIGAYCSGEDKAVLTDILANVKKQMATIIEDADWLTDSGKSNALDKLNHMSMHVLFPDHYISYQDLVLEEGQSIIDMVRCIRLFNHRKEAYRIGTPVDFLEWDLGRFPTTTVNAFHYRNENSVYICAGIVSDGFMFSRDYPQEVNYARIGTTVGHEITHGFDSEGYQFDKYGNKNNIFTYDESFAFDSRISVLKNWYRSLTPIPGGGAYMKDVSTEAIADMGGMRNALLAAAEIPGFDYDLFFRSYAQLWAKVCKEEVERGTAEADIHPLAFLRTNVTVQQFDEFLKTYGLQEGDGMYLAPENRIRIW